MYSLALAAAVAFRQRYCFPSVLEVVHMFEGFRRERSETVTGID